MTSPSIKTLSVFVFFMCLLLSEARIVSNNNNNNNPKSEDDVVGVKHDDVDTQQSSLVISLNIPSKIVGKSKGRFLQVVPDRTAPGGPDGQHHRK
ncbi:hypothetical protein DM860_015677 [Cuscuta australis]|uniref:Uncharacterized protein n=1 Tax=Cuscuta australis TaxID=267555 RepID=A0A328DEZ1_9ASTE|nr:hypothetical protein DM860_015677 [Cuscuta australis]